MTRHMKIWVDDERNPNDFYPGEGWIWITNSRTFFKAMELFEDQVSAISFDNDLGENSSEGAYILDKIEFTYDGKHPPYNIFVHSANPVACARMYATIKKMRERS